MKTIVIKNGKQVAECPYCGNDGFYVHVRVTGRSCTFLKFDGSADDNSGMHDGLSYKPLKTAYCSCCHKKIGTHTEEVTENG